MSMMNFYRCKRCRNNVSLIKKGGEKIACSGKIKADVGPRLNPTLQEHYIEWIALIAEGKAELKFLQPGGIFAYCNQHGISKAEF